MCREESPTKDPEKCPVDVTHKKGGLAVTLERKTFCGTWWERKPDFLWVAKPVGGEEVEVATAADSALKECGCWEERHRAEAIQCDVGLRGGLS